MLTITTAFGVAARPAEAKEPEAKNMEPVANTAPVTIVTAAQIKKTEAALAEASMSVPASIKAVPVKAEPIQHEAEQHKAASVEHADPPKPHIDTITAVAPPTLKPVSHPTRKASPAPVKKVVKKDLASAVPVHHTVHHTVTHTVQASAVKHIASSGKVAAVLAFARAQLGERYVFGGAGPNVWDCSGLTLMAFQAVGVHIGTHSATNQYVTARSRGLLVPYADKKPGDLIFYGNGDMYHVTIYAGNGKMIEAPDVGKPVRERAIWGTPYHMVARFL